MAKMVGFSNPVKLSWLKQAVELKKKALTETEYKDALNEYLSFEIDSPTRLRKTREILMHIWFYSDENDKYRERAIKLIEQSPEDEAVIHYCVTCLSYPVFADICSYMGNILRFRDDLTNAVLKQKLYDEWGERGSLETTSRRVTLTLKEIGLLEAENRTRYVPAKQMVKADATVDFIVEVAMLLGGSSYYSATELADFPLLFPAIYQIKKERLMENKNLSMSNLGGELSFSLVS